MKTTEHPKHCPPGFRWRKIGLKGYGDYLVQYWRNSGPSKYSHCSSLTDSRKFSISVIRESSATRAEIYRYAENGQSIIPVIVAEYGA